MSIVSYKGYMARVEFDAEDELFVGRIANIDDVIEVKNYLANANPDKMRDITLFSYSQQTIDKLTHEKLLEIYRTDK